jgi:hypothetical protein
VAGGVLTLASFSKGGTCFFIRDDPPNDITYGRIDEAAETDCYAANFATASQGQSW